MAARTRKEAQKRTWQAGNGCGEGGREGERGEWRGADVRRAFHNQQGSELMRGGGVRETPYDLGGVSHIPPP